MTTLSTKIYGIFRNLDEMILVAGINRECICDAFSVLHFGM